MKISSWQPVHLFLVQNQTVVRYIFFSLNLISFFLIGLGFYLFNSGDLEAFVFVAQFANKVGQVSLILFLTTLIPGILQRFKVFPLISASIILFRRQIGILMFVLALVHSMFISTIPLLMTTGIKPELLSENAIYGSIALMILFPVWITSNDTSQQILGRFWKTLQRLTFVALLAIFIHVAMANLYAAIITGAILFLEVISWVRFWFFNNEVPKE